MTNKHSRKIQINAFKSISYVVEYCAKSQNLEILDEAFKSAYIDLDKCLKDFTKKAENAMAAFSLIYKESQYFIVKDILRQVLGKLTSNIEISAFDKVYPRQKLL